ncbi:MAG: HDOD domain-containing protein [Bdellovibrionota bacterium]
MSNAVLEENIERAFRHVSNGWLPPHKEVLDKVRAQLHAGHYEGKREQLTADLKEDFALYMYCLRELSSIIESEQSRSYLSGEARGRKLTPTQIFEQAELSAFKSVLNRPDSEISGHSLNQMSDLQALRFRESLISASAAEVLAGKNDIDPDMGFSCGLLRQLGLTLIAWNYPRVYSRAMECITPTESLDFQLQKVLGFSPSLLGLTFARRWNLSDDILVALGDRPKRGYSAAAPSGLASDSSSTSSQHVGDLLSKICEVSEALARANDPEHYPTALQDWEEAEEAIAAQLGPDGMQLIFQRAESNCKQYLKRAPELQGFTETSLLKERIVDSRFATAKLEKNIHLKSCPPALKEKITKLYFQLKPNKILKKNIRTLVFEIIPTAGFKKGCIFMLEPASRLLSPSIKLGELTPDRSRPIKLSSALSHFDLVSSAFSLKSPLREEGVSKDGRRITMIACSIGQAAPMGVLYLETSEDFASEIGPDPMPVFRAIRQALCDCLNLV